MTTKTEVTTSELVQSLTTQTELTMYAATKIYNDVMQANIPVQMLYNYRAKKLIRVNADGRVTIDDLVAFIQKRLDKAAAKNV
jgi:hypothetical protein